MRSVLCLLTGVMLACGWVQAAEPLVSKTFPYGTATPAELKEALPQVLSARGKFILIEPTRKVVVQDEAANVDAAGAIIAELAKARAPGPNIRIDVTLREIGSTSDRNVSVRGSSIHVEPIERNSLQISGRDQSGGSDRMVNQFLVVQSGGSASLQVGEEIPMVDYFYTYALDGGYIVAAATRWQNIGSRLAISPRLNGNLIEVTVTPEITTLVNAEWQVVAFTKLSTTVTIANGGSMEIGGFAQATDEFNRNFFTRGRRSASRVGTITLQASVLEMEPAPAGVKNSPPKATQRSMTIEPAAPPK